MRFLKRLGVGLVLLLGAFIVVVWLQADDYRLTRSAVIAAPAAAVFAQVNDLRKWDDWSPWAKLDPNAKVTFSGPQSGPGATFQWSGNDKVGAGTMTITESKPNERVATRTNFIKPFARTSNSDFVFSAAGGQTDVIWTMSGKTKLHRQGDVPVRVHGENSGAGFREGLGAADAGDGEKVSEADAMRALPLSGPCGRG